MNKNELKSIISNTFNLKGLPENISIDNVAGWDSLGHLKLILALEEYLGFQFDMDEIPTLITFDKIYEAINARYCKKG